ncbi:MAG TPA: squalene/phytoene synthase family protein [Candidatus Limnocylindrales bacterium]|nr:squalene/phytoene synthase family protein [Candidatus Limnocylindrales bacterium]
MRVERIIDSVRVEKTITAESVALLRKNPAKYSALVGGLYLLSTQGLELGQLGRASYFFARHVDNILDGDRQVREDPLSYAVNLRNQIAERKFDPKDPIAHLAEYSLGVFDRIKRPEDNPQQDILDLIDVMIFDHERAKDRRALSADDLEEYYYRTVYPGTNLMLTGFRSQLRAGDIPQFSTELGRIYSARDLDEDWTEGFINIPKEILDLAGLTPASSLEEVRGNSTIDTWFDDELTRSKDILKDLRSAPQVACDTRTKIAIRGFINRAIDYNKRK